MVNAPRGFVLLVVLVVLAVAGTVLAAAARRSGERALRAGAEGRALQTKWGTLSIEALCLPQAEQILSDHQAPEDEPLVVLRRSVRLGGVDFHLVLSDEQSKANVNLLARRRGDTDLADSLRILQSRLRHALHVQLRPRDGREEVGGASRARYASFEQLYDVEHPSDLVKPDLAETVPADRVTCWGSGRVNLKRAEVPVLRQVLEGLVTEAQLDRLQQFRRDAPDATASQILEHLDLSKEQKERVVPFVTDASRCHGLWVVAVGQTRNRYRFSVLQTGQTGNDSRFSVFTW